MLKFIYSYRKFRFILLLVCVICVKPLFGLNKTVTMHPAPIPNFEISHFCLGDTAFFTNTTVLGNTYIWHIYKIVTGTKGSIMDSLVYTSTNFNINYVFQSSGTYIIELTANNGHIITIDRNITINRYNVTNAEFDYMYCGSIFINLSVCYDACLWDFGDGQTSTLNSPVHYYDTIGTYQVKLISHNATSSDTVIKAVYVSQTKNLDGGFSTKINKDSVLFITNDSITGPFTQYHWSFGDGVVSDLYSFTGGRKVYHTYQKKDTTYSVFLLVKTSCLAAFSQSNLFVPDSTPVFSTYIYPNPSSDNSMLHIVTNRKAELTNMSIINSLGQQMDTTNYFETSRGWNVNISDFSKGVYMIRLWFGKDVIVKKIIKE